MKNLRVTYFLLAIYHCRTYRALAICPFVASQFNFLRGIYRSYKKFTYKTVFIIRQPRLFFSFKIWYKRLIYGNCSKFYWNKLLFGVIPKPNHEDRFLEIFDPPPLWTILLNVVIWTFDNPSFPFHSPHSLWMTPSHKNYDLYVIDCKIFPYFWKEN